MKNSQCLWVFSCIVLSMSACQTEQKPFSDTFHSHAEIFLPSDSIQDPLSICLLGDHIILGNKVGNPLLEVFDVKTGQKEGGFLQKGKGPLEFLFLGTVQPDANSGVVYATDVFQRKTVKYPLNQALQNPLLKPDLVYEELEESTLKFDKVYVTKSNLIAENMTPEGRVLLLNQDGSPVGYYLPFPNKDLVDKSLNEQNNVKLYISAITINPTMDKMAMATYNAGKIDLLSIKDGAVETIWSYESFLPSNIRVVPMGEQVVAACTRETQTGFTDICSTDKYVYALYSGKKIEDKSYNFGNEIYVTSWDGKETYKVMLDHSINRLAVNSDDKTIYGISQDMNIWKFTLTK